MEVAPKEEALVPVPDLGRHTQAKEIYDLDTGSLAVEAITQSVQRFDVYTKKIYAVFTGKQKKCLFSCRLAGGHAREILLKKGLYTQKNMIVKRE